MKFDWRTIARIGANVAAQATGIPAIQIAEQATESAVQASAAHQTPDQQIDAYANLALQVVASAEGFSGKELVNDANVQILVKNVHDALHALAAGLAAAKGVPLQPVPAA